MATFRSPLKRRKTRVFTKGTPNTKYNPRPVKITYMEGFGPPKKPD